LEVPAELEGWIKTVGETDPTSDYFRYPVSKNADADKEKSPFKEVTPESLFPAAREKNEYVRALVVENSQGELVKVFAHDSATNKGVAEAVRNAADMLSNFHAMMRFVITGGW
jgi:hypothetical protein